jgi:hypothetical protein
MFVAFFQFSAAALCVLVSQLLTVVFAFFVVSVLFVLVDESELDFHFHHHQE